MSISDTGIGDAYKRNVQPMYAYDLEATAWTQTNKQWLGIVPNSVDTFEINLFVQQLQTQEWRQTAPGKPTLPPITRVRMGMEPKEKRGDQPWQGVYKKLVESLPKDVQEELKAVSGQPLDMRNLNYVALANNLVVLAKGIVWLKEAALPADPTSALVQKNMLLPYVALGQAVNQGQEIFDAVNTYLNSVGHSHPEFDQLMGVATDISVLLQDLTDLRDSIRVDIRDQGALGTGTTLLLASLAREVTRQSDNFHAVKVSNNLRILSPLFRVLEAVTAAFTTGKANPSLLLGFRLASTGILFPSATALFGETFTKLSSAVNEALITSMVWGTKSELQEMDELRDQLVQKKGETLSKQQLEALISALDQAIAQKTVEQTDQVNEGTKRLLMMLTNTLLLAAVGASALTAQSGIGIFPSQDADNVADARAFSYEISLHLVAATDLLRETFQGLIRGLGGTKETAAFAADSWSALSLLLVLRAGARGVATRQQELLESLQPHLSLTLDRVSQFLTDAIGTGKVSLDAASRFTLALNQCQSALEEGNYGAVIAVTDEALKDLLGVTPEQLDVDMRKMENFSKVLMYAFTTGFDDLAQNVTHIIQTQ